MRGLDPSEGARCTGASGGDEVFRVSYSMQALLVLDGLLASFTPGMLTADGSLLRLGLREIPIIDGV